MVFIQVWVSYFMLFPCQQYFHAMRPHYRGDYQVCFVVRNQSYCRYRDSINRTLHLLTQKKIQQSIFGQGSEPRMLIQWMWKLSFKKVLTSMSKCAEAHSCWNHWIQYKIQSYHSSQYTITTILKKKKNYPFKRVKREMA